MLGTGPCERYIYRSARWLASGCALNVKISTLALEIMLDLVCVEGEGRGEKLHHDDNMQRRLDHAK